MGFLAWEPKTSPVCKSSKSPYLPPSSSLPLSLPLSLSYDHRVIDGALGANLLNAIKENLENPMTMLA